MTLVKEQRSYTLYFDDILADNFEIENTAIRFGDIMHFGGWIGLMGPIGAKYDNIQMFNKALTLG